MLVREDLHATKSADPIAKVRKLIRRKTSERDRLLQEIAQCETALMPMRQQQLAMAALDNEIHQLFRVLLAKPELSKRAQREIRGVYEGLQADQIISIDPEWARERASLCACPACSALRDQVSEPHTQELEEPDSDGPEPRRAEHEQRTQQRPEREASVRALYHKLALRFHPDRADDDARRAEHEAVMRDVNDAYHGGDTERLLTLSRELGIEVGDLQGGHGLLGELVEQYERIKAEVRELRSSPLGTLVAEMRRARQRGYRSPIDDLDEQAEVALEQLSGTRDFVRDFAQGKISLKTFLRGPQLDELDELGDSDEVFIEVLDMVERLDRAVRKTNQSARSKSRRAPR
jgi:hypothetical protein